MEKGVTPNKVETASEDTLKSEVKLLSEVFPQFVKDGVIDFDAFREFFGEKGALSEANQERYGLSWKGKSDAFKAIRVPATGTLTPQEEESKNWDTTENVFIEGDNLETLKLLQRHYRGKIKMIYIDPPYNTGKDFIYKDNFTEDKSDYYEKTGQYEGGIALTSNPASNGRYHSDWLTMMYPRLFLARQLLRDDGVIFISIDDNEVTNLRLIMDEIFGEENFITQLIWQKKTGASDSTTISTITEYILVYVRDYKLSETSFEKNKKSYDLDRYSLQDDYLEERGPYYIDNLDRGGLRYSDSLNYPIKCPDGSITYPNGRTVFKNDGWIWKWSEKKFKWGIENGFIEFRRSKTKDSGWAVCYKNYLNVDNEGNRIERAAPLKNLITDILNADAAYVMKEVFGTNIFQYSKPVELIKRLIGFVKFNEKEIVMDFFAGSGTTAHATMELNAEDGGSRKWICVQIPEETTEDSETRKAGYKTIAEISRERIRHAGQELHDALTYADNPNDLPKRDYAFDYGFKSYKLSSSNYRQWQTLGEETTEEELKEQMKIFIEQPLIDGYSEKNVVHEIALKEGYSLNVKVEKGIDKEKGEVGSVHFWTATDDDRLLVATFATQINEVEIDQIATMTGLTKQDSHTLVTLDSALTDSTKINLARNFNLKII